MLEGFNVYGADAAERMRDGIRTRSRQYVKFCENGVMVRRSIKRERDVWR